MRGEAESGDVGDMRLRVLACRENLPVGPRLSAGGLPQCRNEVKKLLSPGLCASHVPTPPRLPCARACVYSSPSRRTPMCGRANPENRILRKTQEVRQTIQDRLTKVA